MRSILFTSTAALLLMSTSYIIFEYLSFRESTREKVSTLGLVIASNSSAALAFQSKEDAIEILSALEADKYINAACIYDAEGNVFAKYPDTASNSTFPSKPEINGYTFKTTSIEGFEPISQEKLFLGTLYIRSSLEGLNSQLRFHILVALFLIGLTLTLGYFLSRMFEKTITDPLISLENTARSISVKKDYSIRADKWGNDEVGSLTDAFNYMLSQIEAQNEKIVKNEEHLRVATQSAELGTFEFDLKSGELSWDERCRELFGIYTDEPVSYDDDFLPGLHEDDRERVILAVENAFKKELTGGEFDMDYRTVGSTDKRLRWVKATGKVFFDEQNKAIRFIGSVLDITQQKLDEQRKNDFIAIISHELKTPLTSIKSYVQLVLSKTKKDSDSFMVNALTRADIQASKMASMIKDFLNLAQIEQGQLKLIKETFDLSALLQESVIEAKLLNSSHQIELDSCTDLRVTADKDKIGQVLINLISNAVKYSPNKSTITVGCQVEDSMVRIFVKDHGHGISVNDQKKLFTRFYRVENEKSKTISGFGIGLFIVSEILRYHESKIRLHTVEGKGSEFYFYLPNHSPNAIEA